MIPTCCWHNPHSYSSSTNIHYYPKSSIILSVAFCSSRERQIALPEMVSTLAAKNSDEEESMLISLDIEDDKLFLLHFIIGTYFGPDLRNHHQNQSTFQIQAASNNPTSDELNDSMMKRAELERVYHYILKNADPSLILKPKALREYFNGKRRDFKGDFPLFRDLYPLKNHPETRIGNQCKFIKNIVFINEPDTSCMSQDCIERFQQLTGLQSFSIDLNGISQENATINVAAKSQPGPIVGLMDIGECDDAYLFRVSLPGVKRDERDFSCEVEDNGKVVVRGVTITGEKQVHRYSQVFKMQTQNLCLPGHFSVSFHLPGPVHPQEFSGSFGTDGIFEGVVMKNLQKKIV